RTAASPGGERATIVVLAVAVVSVTAPAGSGGKFSFQNGVDYAQRVFDQRLSGPPDAVTHQFEKARIDDFGGGKICAFAGGAIADRDNPVVRVLVMNRSVGISWVDADVMARDAGQEDAVVSDSPGFEVLLNEIRE